MLGARGVVRLEPLGEREQARGGNEAAGARAEPAHAPAAVAQRARQLARPRRVPPHRAPHQVAHLKLARALAPAPTRGRLALCPLRARRI